MKFSLAWLKTHLDTDADLQTITDTLTNIGLELESVTDPGAALAPFRIAHVVEAVQHPNADRLRACKVDTGDGIVSVVCGAPNARTGMKAVFAAPGDFIPGKNVTLKIGEIRGVQSAGMLLSADEMGLGGDHDGIIELPGDAPVGKSYAQWAGLDDPLIEISVTPNRGDAFSVRGIARDLAAAGLGKLKPFAPVKIPSSFDDGIAWKIDWPDACPFVLGRTIRNVKNGPSPQWLQDRLRAIGLRPINSLVDITNFFAIDLGRPLHVFDADKVAGRFLTIRRGAGEVFAGLHGKDITADPEDCLIADANGAVSMAGIVGGASTGCDETTMSVFVECALFDPVRIALSGRRHQITSDARQRFERGIDAGLMPDAMEAATRMILDLCGGEPGAVTQAGAPPVWTRSATLRFRRLAELGGSDVPADEAVAALQRLGFGLQARDAEKVTVSVPTWRNDVAAPIALEQAPSLATARAALAAEGCAEIEPECDLIEEVLRLRGLDTIMPISLPRAAPVPTAALTAQQNRVALTRRTLAGLGLAECVTFSFMPKTVAEKFGPTPDALRLSNPIAADLDQLRPTPIATLALAAARNTARGYVDLALFEIGPAFTADTPEGQHKLAAGLRVGTSPRHWLERSRGVDAMDAKSDLWTTLAAIGVPLEALMISTDAPGFYHPGRSGVVRQGPKTVIAHFGELHPGVLATLDIPGPAVAFEIFLDAIPEPKRRKRSTPDLPAFQPLRRDFAFLVDANIAADAVVRAARGAERTLIAGVSLFDLYAGDKLPDGKKSIAIEVVFQPRERTLTDAEIEAASQKLVAAVTKATGAALRG
ncbi:MAG: phenylalanine--tRNA ligase subunit beta [Acetobacteraceae bacterium]|nr:phenylalanine--tRNA ligase subunit beta [Acetobacteraceae bacterium]MSP30904.1 phenylalanine--tRNA ligase subunit beta [Acetobacteraceae bacterium]